MKTKLLTSIIFILLFNDNPAFSQTQKWISDKQAGYNLYYTNQDEKFLTDYTKLFSNGLLAVEAFFGSSLEKDFDIYIHPDRQSLDNTWRKDWSMPEFKSECWMVASGISTKLDIISPVTWDKVACEHDYSETTKTQQLITHELIHVYHGQKNISPDFSNTEKIDWFVEGLATYASGQCDSVRLTSVKKAIKENKIPKSLDDFWTGNLKYGLAGSVVMYIDNKYGREKLKALLPLNKKEDILSSLKISEAQLIDSWKIFMKTR